MKRIHLFVLIAALSLVGCKSKYPNLTDGLYADIQTNQGDILVKLAYDKTPVTVANFVTLSKGTNEFVDEKYKGKKYYDSIIFHRVIKDFMIQGGDPEGTGRGNPGYRFKNEIAPEISHDTIGIISMANSGPDTNGSQFFITHKAAKSLDGGYSAFGRVVQGFEVVEAIATTETHKDAAKRDRPKTDMIIKTIDIIVKGKDAKNFNAEEVFNSYFKEAEAKEAAEKKAFEEKEAVAKINREALVEEFKKQLTSAQKTASGLNYIILNKGTNEKPVIGNKVLVNYAGFMQSNGNIFDSNIKAVAEKFNVYNPQRDQQGGYNPFPMDYSPDAALITGFKEGLLLMNVGDKYRIFIPSHLAYGPQGNPRAKIGPNEDLVFDLEITGKQ